MLVGNCNPWSEKLHDSTSSKLKNVLKFPHNVACEQALKLNWEPASMANEFEYLRLKSWREILIGQML
jgi:hypothetical protein